MKEKHENESSINNELRIFKLQQKIEEKKESLAKSARPSWKTNCLVICSENATKINLQVVSTEEELLKLYAEIVGKNNLHSEAAVILGSDLKFLLNGYSFENWTEDFKTRLGIINITAEKQKLQKLEKLLETLESEESKKNKLLKQIEDELG